MSYINKLLNRKINIHPPKFLADNICYEVIMGSIAYGVNNDESDMDIYGFCIPPKEEIFPHLKGEILGFGRQNQRFEQYIEHHIEDKEKSKNYDITIYNIVKYFSLVMENNPNMIDSLFVPERCVLSCNRIGNIIRENRKLFLHKGSWHKFKGYSYSQLHKIDLKTFESNEKRKQDVIEHGYSTKFAYHVIRLLNEVEQILITGDLVLDQNREQLKSIRRGEWSLDQIKEYFEKKEKDLEQVYLNSKLPYGPNEEKIKELLLNCLEEHYGSLDKCIKIEGKELNALREIKEIIERFNI